jgi:hypothetical protein
MTPEHSAVAQQPITTWFLVLGLFLPRVTLVAAYLTHNTPPNNVPLLADVLGAVFLPRVLICIYIAMNLGYHGWFWLHLIVALLVYASSASKGDEIVRQRRVPPAPPVA